MHDREAELAQHHENRDLVKRVVRCRQTCRHQARWGAACLTAARVCFRKLSPWWLWEKFSLLAWGVPPPVGAIRLPCAGRRQLRLRRADEWTSGRASGLDSPNKGELPASSPVSLAAYWSIPKIWHSKACWRNESSDAVLRDTSTMTKTFHRVRKCPQWQRSGCCGLQYSLGRLLSPPALSSRASH